jgi:uncharacterized protein (UPF0276 family)
MNAASLLRFGRPDRDLRFPAYSLAGMAGTSLKHEHISAIDANPPSNHFFEVHAENYMGAGGAPHRILERIRRDYPISLHGVCMSIGGPNPIDPVHLERFRDLVDRYEPALVSEHLAWSTHQDVFFNDLLPLPYNEASLAHVAAHINQVQDHIRRPLLLENPSAYLTFTNATMSETDFIRSLASKTGCGLLLDVNNVFVSATNQSFSAADYLASLPIEHVQEIHLAGHATQTDDEGDVLLIDSHDRRVADPVWDLFETVIRVRGAVPTLIEWDSDLPPWETLRAEASAAANVLARYCEGRRVYARA